MSRSFWLLAAPLVLGFLLVMALQTLPLSLVLAAPFRLIGAALPLPLVLTVPFLLIGAAICVVLHTSRTALTTKRLTARSLSVFCARALKRSFLLPLGASLQTACLETKASGVDRKGTLSHGLTVHGSKCKHPDTANMQRYRQEESIQTFHVGPDCLGLRSRCHPRYDARTCG